MLSKKKCFFFIIIIITIIYIVNHSFHTIMAFVVPTQHPMTIENTDMKKINLDEDFKKFGTMLIFNVKYDICKPLTFKLPTIEINNKQFNSSVVMPNFINKKTGQTQDKCKLSGFLSLTTKPTKNKEYYLDEDLKKINIFNNHVNKSYSFLKHIEKTIITLTEQMIDNFNETCVDENDQILDFYDYTFKSMIIEKGKYLKSLKFNTQHFVDKTPTQTDNGEKMLEKFTTRFSFLNNHVANATSIALYTFKKIEEVIKTNNLCTPVMTIENIWINPEKKEYGINVKFVSITLYPALIITEMKPDALGLSGDEDDKEEDDLLAMTRPTF